MTIDLTPYTSIQSNLFVRVDIHDYQVLRFSDYHRALTINTESYGALGQLLNITDTTTELRATAQEITITITGIPVSRVQEILAVKLKGSPVKIYRAFFDVVTGNLISVSGNPAEKFQGMVTNFSILDDAGSITGEAGTITLALIVTSAVEQLETKVTGRRTNPIDQRALYPTDAAFDRVPNLAGSNFNFGAP